MKKYWIFSYSNNKGFALIEISMVIVIIGLIISSILFGKDLINAANIRSASAQLEQFKTIFNTFKLKYNCEAGDCTNATSFLGNYMQNNNSCDSLTNGRGNGNGNGMLDNGGSTHWYCEGYNAVESLKTANMMPSKTTYEQLLGINNSIAFFYHDDVMGRAPVKNKSTLTWARDNMGYAVGGAFSPVEGLSIDIKIDDGIPNKGNFISLDTAASGSTTIIDDSCSTNGVYNRNETYTCRSIFYYQ